MNSYAIYKKYQGQCIWLKDYSRNLANRGVLSELIQNNIITGIVLNSIALANSIDNSTEYDGSIRSKLKGGMLGEELAQYLILADTCYASVQIMSIFDQTDEVNGWVVLPLSPFIADEKDDFLDMISEIHKKANKPNILITLSGEQSHLETIEEAVYLGWPLNISNIVSPAQCSVVTHACLKGIRKRITDKLDVTSPIFITIPMDKLDSFLRLHVPTEQVAATLLATSQDIHNSMKQFHDSMAWEEAYNAGVRPFRIIWNVSCDQGEIGCELSRHHSPSTVLAWPEEFIQQFIPVNESSVENAPLRLANEWSQVDECEIVNFKELAIAAQKYCRELDKKNWMQMLETLARKSAQISQDRTTLKKEEK